MAGRLTDSAVVQTSLPAILVCAGCYVGATSHDWLRFPGIGTAILFPPYAIVTTALLFVPPRRWWAILLAASLGDYFPHRAGGAEVSFVLMTEGVNHLRACLAALALRRFTRGPGTFDTMSDMGVFLLFAVLLAPALGALGGAATLHLHDAGPAFADVWRAWFLSNAITALAIVPALAASVRWVTARAPLPGISAGRLVEAALVSLSLLGVAAAVFGSAADPPGGHPARLFWPLPMLLWAAVRFGSTGTSVALLAVTSLSIWGAIEHRGPFVAQSPAGNLMELQMFLLAISVPLLLLAAVFRQQQRTAAALDESRRLHQAAEDERRRLEVQQALASARRDADHRKDEFLAMLGHELRNPLAPIAIAVEILRLAPAGSAESAWSLESIERQLQHMTRLLDDLLDISRITLGRIRLNRETVDLAQVAAHAVETAGPLVASLGHRLAVTAPAGIFVDGDEVRLTQVLANLLNNAAKYTKPGGRIDLTIRVEGETAIVSVRDNGIGIPSEALERIFEPFIQLGDGHALSPGGLGIGLSLVRRLVELHGGTVEALNVRGSAGGDEPGTELVVRLPLSAIGSALQRSASPAAGAVRGARGLRVLAVDDNADVLEGLSRVLALWGHNVRTAPDGAAAIQVASEFAPEVVLLDLGLPKLDGLEVARRLVGHDKPPPALLISMSGFGQEQALRRSRDAGFHHHLVKPIDVDSLRALLAQDTTRDTTRDTTSDTTRAGPPAVQSLRD
jgi:signal transduction histidine kinase/FixJ family two-component response regulator